MNQQELYRYGYDLGTRDKNLPQEQKWIHNEKDVTKHQPALWLGYMTAVMGLEIEEKKEFKINVKCFSCGLLIKRYKAEADIKVEVFTDTNAGHWPVHLCPCCWDYWQDKSKREEDNPRYQQRKEVTNQIG